MFSLWGLAFRPLFLFGCLFSLLAVAWWGYFWWLPFSWQPYGGAIWWHGHEMLFGFVAVIVVGFLLTAVQNWTGVPGLKGRPLQLLFVSWLLGRVVLVLPFSLPAVWVMLIDCAFLLFSAMAMSYPVLKVKQWRNLIFVPILFLLFTLNAISHWAVVTDQPLTATRTLHAAIMLFVLLVSIIGGRVIPFFTASKMNLERLPANKWIEVFSIAPLILLVAVAVLGFERQSPWLMTGLCLPALLAHSWRLSRWGGQHCRSVPLLWSLHLSYLFIPLGLLLLMLASWGLVSSFSAALHGFTVGAIAGMILAMVSRVVLGHTGRPLQPPTLMTWAFVLIGLSALLRALLPGFVPAVSHWAIATSSVCWLLAYGLLVFYYAPMLLKARVDGRPG